MIIVRLLSPGPWLVGTTKVYSGVGADIVMESITLTENWPNPRSMSEIGIFQQLAVLDILAPSEQSEPNVSHHQVTCASQNGGVPGWCASDCDYRPRSDRVRSSHNGFAGR